MEPVTVDWRNVAVTLLLAAATGFGVAWFQETRVRAAEQAVFDKWEAKIGLRDEIMAEAVSLLALNPTERGLAVAQATTNILQRRRDKHAGVADPQAPIQKAGR